MVATRGHTSRWGQYAALGIVLALLGQSVAASKTPPAPGTNHSTNPKGYQHAPKPAPIVVQVVPTPKTKAEAAQQESDRKHRADIDWWMVRLTGGLVFAAVVQAVITGITLRGLRHAKTAADAAKEAADAAKTNADAAQKSAAISEIALVHANRAYIDIVSIYNDWGLFTDPITSVVTKQLRVSVKVKNRGSTPATQLSMEIGKRTGQPNAAPGQPIPIKDDLGTGYIAPDNENSFADMIFSRDEVMKVFRRQHRICILLKINYRDVFDGTPNRVFQNSVEMTFLGNPEMCWNTKPGDAVPDIIRWAPAPELSVVT